MHGKSLFGEDQLVHLVIVEIDPTLGEIVVTEGPELGFFIVCNVGVAALFGVLREVVLQVVLFHELLDNWSDHLRVEELNIRFRETAFEDVDENLDHDRAGLVFLGHFGLITLAHALYEALIIDRMNGAVLKDHTNARIDAGLALLCHDLSDETIFVLFFAFRWFIEPSIPALNPVLLGMIAVGIDDGVEQLNIGFNELLLSLLVSGRHLEVVVRLTCSFSSKIPSKSHWVKKRNGRKLAKVEQLIRTML